MSQLHLNTWVFPKFNQSIQLNIDKKLNEMMIYSGVSYFFWECTYTMGHLDLTILLLYPTQLLKFNASLPYVSKSSCYGFLECRAMLQATIYNLLPTLYYDLIMMVRQQEILTCNQLMNESLGECEWSKDMLWSPQWNNEQNNQRKLSIITEN